MLKFHLIGDWPEGRVACTRVPSTFSPPPDAAARIERNWSLVLQRLGPHLFDGPMCRLESFHVRPDGTLHLSISTTSYKFHYGTNILEPELEDRYGPNALAKPLGVSCALITSDGFLMLGSRNENVAYYPARIHPFAGALEPADPLNVFDEARRELAEELSLTPEHLADIRCAAVVEDRLLRHPELILLVRARLARAEVEQRVDTKEHHDSYTVAPDAPSIDVALRNPLLTPVAIAAVALRGRSLLGPSWFGNVQRMVEQSPAGDAGKYHAF